MSHEYTDKNTSRYGWCVSKGASWWIWLKTSRLNNSRLLQRMIQIRIEYNNIQKCCPLTDKMVKAIKPLIVIKTNHADNHITIFWQCQQPQYCHQQFVQRPHYPCWLSVASISLRLKGMHALTIAGADHWDCEESLWELQFVYTSRDNPDLFVEIVKNRYWNCSLFIPPEIIPICLSIYSSDTHLSQLKMSLRWIFHHKSHRKFE